MNGELTLIHNLKKWWRNSRKKDVIVELPFGRKRTDLVLDFRLIGIIKENGKIQVVMDKTKYPTTDFINKNLDDDVIKYLLRLELAATENIIPNFRIARKTVFEDQYKNKIPDLID